jgi:putative transposase
LSAGLVASAKELKPYWTAVCAKRSTQLWLPCEIDKPETTLAVTNKTLGESWFSAQVVAPAVPINFYQTYANALASLLPERSEIANRMTKTRKIRLYPTAQQRALFKRWLGASRYVYNKTLEYLKSLTGKRPTWTEIATYIILPALPHWAQEIPFQIKKMAVKEACDKFSEAKQKYKRTGQFSELRYKSRKAPRQTCLIPKSAVKPQGIYYTISGAMKYAETLPVDFLDCELSWQQGRWYVCVPFVMTMPMGENQARIVALDPGVRTFQAFFSPELAGLLGQYDFSRLVRLCRWLDKLLSRISTSTKKKQRYRMRQAANRLRWKIRDLRDELHAKTIRFLVDNFDVILIPIFDTSQMVTRGCRRLRSKTVRSMLTWAHFKFKEWLKVVASEYGKTVIEVNEAYTSKTCSWSGEVVKIGSSEIIRGSDGISMHRDVNGARGIFLRALAELPSLESLQRALVNNAYNP